MRFKFWICPINIFFVICISIFVIFSSSSCNAYSIEKEIGSEGGVIEVNDPGSSIYGFKMEIPEGLFSDKAKIKITLKNETNIIRDMGFPGGKKISDIIQIEVDGKISSLVGFKQVLITFPYKGNIGDENIILCRYCPNTNEYYQISNISIDNKSNVIKARMPAIILAPILVTASEYGTTKNIFGVIGITPSPKEYLTGFDPKRDTLNIENFTNYEGYIDNQTPKANCFGLSYFAVWYFSEYNVPSKKPLSERFTEGEEKIVAKNVSRFQNRWEKILEHSDTSNLSKRSCANQIKALISSTNKPTVVYLVDQNGKGEHTIVSYGYKRNNENDYTIFYAYDPNNPNSVKKFGFDEKNGCFLDYISGENRHYQKPLFFTGLFKLAINADEIFPLEVEESKTIPSNNNSNVSYDKDVIIEFTQKLNTQQDIDKLIDIKPYIFKKKTGIEANRLSIKPENGWNPGIKYSVTVKSNIKNEYNNCMGQDYQMIFRTKPEYLNIAAALVMDKSGSMDGIKTSMANDAASALIDLLKDDDWFSVSGFWSDGGNYFPATPKQASNNSTIKQNLSHPARGEKNTNIGAGLSDAIAQLSQIPTEVMNNNRKFIVLLSDGMNNTGTFWDKVAQCQPSGIKIHTVGFGNDADEKTLMKIAHDTGGTYSHSDISNIVSVYSLISCQAQAKTAFYSYSDFVRSGSNPTYRFSVDNCYKDLIMFVNWQGSDLDPVIITPDDREIRLSEYKKHFEVERFVKRDRYCFAQIRKPSSGEWQLQLNPEDFPSQGERVNINVAGGDKDLFVITNSLKSQYNRGEEIPIVVKPSYYDKGQDKYLPLKEAEVRADIVKPGAKPQEVFSGGKIRLGNLLVKEITRNKCVQLHDQGDSNDEEEGDGVYGNTYNIDGEDGPYLVTITIKWNNAPGGKTITRTIRKNFQVGAYDRGMTLHEFLNLVR